MKVTAEDVSWTGGSVLCHATRARFLFTSVYSTSARMRSIRPPPFPSPVATTLPRNMAATRRVTSSPSPLTIACSLSSRALRYYNRSSAAVRSDLALAVGPCPLWAKSVFLFAHLDVQQRRNLYSPANPRKKLHYFLLNQAKL